MRASPRRPRAPCRPKGYAKGSERAAVPAEALGLTVLSLDTSAGPPLSGPPDPAPSRRRRRKPKCPTSISAP